VSGLRNAASLLVALVSGVAAAAQTPRTGPDADARFATVEHAYVVYSMRRLPVMATYLGGSSFDPSLADTDGTLRDDSPAAIGAEDARLRELRAQFAQLEPRHLSGRRRIDRTVALAQIDLLLHQHEVLRLQQRSLDAYVEEPRRGVDWLIQEGQWQHVLARTRAVPAYLAMARQQLAAGVRAGHPPDWRVLVEFGLAGTVADGEYFSRTLPGIAQQSLSGATRESLLRPLQQAGADAALAYQQLHDYIAATFFLDPSGSDAKALKLPFRADRFALGESEYDWALHNNLHLDTTATALYPQSWLAVQSGRAQLLGVARAIALAHHWTVPAGTADVMVRSVFEHLEQEAPATDAAMVEAYGRTSQRLVTYARSTHLFEVPTQYRLDATVAPSPPVRVFSSDGPDRFYVAPTGDDPALLRRLHNLAAQPELAAREGFPGHDWHYRIMAENRAVISAVRWLTLASDAGWALYAQALMAEPRPGAPHGFYSPEERLYQLRTQLDRAVRVRIDTGLHTGRLSFEDAVTLMSEVVDFMPGSCHDVRLLAQADKRASCERARDEVGRCARRPTRAITAWLGKEQLQSLRRRAQRLFATDFSEQRFHLELMRQGTIPVGYFAEELLRNLGRPAGN
jgi:uncharacterized protein (DUF885 family)